MIHPNDILYAGKLKALRKSRKIKQSVFSELMGWKDQQECSDYENSKKHFTEPVITKLCEVLAVSFEEFVLTTSPSLKASKRKTKPKPKNNTKKEDLESALWPQDSFIAINLKKILLEKEMTIRELKLELYKYRSLNKIAGFQADSDKKIYVLI